MALSTTTLSRAVAVGDRLWSLTSASGLSLPSVSGAGLDPVRMLFCDGEAALVTNLVGNETVEVFRGQLGSRVGAHASGATVYVCRSSDLYQQDPVGAPPATPAITPWINTINGTVWTASGGAWISAGAGGASATAAYPASTDGVQTLLTATGTDRSVIISVQVTTVFADGDGAQPTFTIGQTGSATKFAAAARFTDAAAGSTFSFSGTLTANTALIVTATAGTGTTETGALSVTVIAVPV